MKLTGTKMNLWTRAALLTLISFTLQQQCNGMVAMVYIVLIITPIILSVNLEILGTPEQSLIRA